MRKPILYGPLIRAATFAFIALFALKGPFVVLAEEAARQHEPRPPEFLPLLWGSAIAVFVTLGILAWRVAMEAFPPNGTHYFPVNNKITLIDALVSPVALLLMLLLGLLPRMWINPMGGFGMREMDVTELFVIPPMGLALMLWRPMWAFTRGQPITRYPAGPWLPWKQEFPVKPQLVWDAFFVGKTQRVQVGWQLRANLGELQFDLEFAALSTPQAKLDAIQAQWASLLDTGIVADAATQAAALNRKKVKPWHILAAIFGLPGLMLSLSNLPFARFSPGADVGLYVLLTSAAAALSLWFFSRFVSVRAITVMTGGLALIIVGGTARGVLRGNHDRLESRLTYVCDGSPIPQLDDPIGARWLMRGSYSYEATPNQDTSRPPKIVVCQKPLNEVVERREEGRYSFTRERTDLDVTVRDTRTGEVLLQQIFRGEEPPPFNERDLRQSYGKPASRETIEAALAPSLR